MLPRQPLRFLLADDPGAGKTIMAGLLIKELIVRGDLQRCLVVCPGSLAEQWQDELYRRFHLRFDILTHDKLESAGSGNWFLETNLAIARLDKLSRDEDVQQKLQAPDCGWDLIVCDEAHKMSASSFGGEVRYTKRHHLGRLLSTLTRHFLLMTATPHNGKEEDFQLFMALLDGDRFEGRFRDGVHAADVSDLMADADALMPGGLPPALLQLRVPRAVLDRTLGKPSRDFFYPMVSSWASPTQTLPDKNMRADSVCGRMAHHSQQIQNRIRTCGEFSGAVLAILERQAWNDSERAFSSDRAIGIFQAQECLEQIRHTSRVDKLSLVVILCFSLGSGT
jgi:hypothetical protein